MARRAASAAACSSSAGIAIHFVFSLFVVDLGGSPTVWIYRVGSLVPDCDSSSPFVELL